MMNILLITTLIYVQAVITGVNPKFAESIARTESSLRPQVIAHEKKTNSKSYGLFQLRYSTAQELGFKGSRKELLDINLNIEYGVKQIKACQVKYGNDLNKIACCYNAGLYRSAKVCKSGQVRGYIKKVRGYYE